MPVQRDTSGEMAESIKRGIAAFWNGEAFDIRNGHDWCDGWLAAAAEARHLVTQHRQLIDRCPKIAEAMREAFAAFKQLEGVSKLRPGDRSRMNSAAVKIGAALPYVEPSGGSNARKERRP